MGANQWEGNIAGLTGTGQPPFQPVEVTDTLYALNRQ
jgi:hypothetical protein